ncbi:MAG: winged helix DNA-binding domain-containing protein [Candidatus Heimdallarchaeota archaeon]|nr:MAG: winged helix DNA-binding domain-containing protein [Candidatus Heimdallarchaeota archaeon]
MPSIPHITQKELKRLLIVGCHLHRWQGNDVRKIIKEQGLIQLDPLNPAGRYHDYFFSSRIQDYQQGDYEKIAYSEKLIFESYFHNLNAIHVDFFPLFYSQTLGRDQLGRYYSRALKILEETHPDMLDQVLEYVRSHGITRGSDLTELGKADPKYAVWKTSRNSGTALELLWAMGKLAVLRDNNFRKTYDLIENYIEKSHLKKESYSEEEQRFMKLKLKIKSFPVTPTGKITIKKDGKIRFGKRIAISPEKLLIGESTKDLLPSLVQLEDEGLGFIVPSNWENLCQQELDDEMRVIGPLDPLIWDRQLLNKLFSYEYVWEVYKKPKDRVWGYYVYPLFYSGDFIGRLEAKFETKSKILRLFNFQGESHLSVDENIKEAFQRLLTRWKFMVQAEGVENDETLPFI